MDGFARRKEQSKDDIRKAALELFSQFGVDKVSIADIAKKAEVSQATIYNNFGSKEALIREFVNEIVAQLMDRVQGLIIPGQPFTEKMAAFIQFISTMILEGKPSAVDRTIFTSSIDLQNDPEIRKIRGVAQEKMSRIMLELIEEGKQQGQVNPQLSNEALGIYLKMFMDVFSTPALHDNFRRNPALINELGYLMIHGLGK